MTYCITHVAEVEQTTGYYRGYPEQLAECKSLGDAVGLQHIGVHLERLPPGRRTSWPHAEEAEDEFIWVIEGEPDVWIDGVLHPLRPGSVVGFPSGTGVSHTFINNSSKMVLLLVAGQRNKANRTFYPLLPSNDPRGEHAWPFTDYSSAGDHPGTPD